MTTEPVFSVIIPTYNRADHVLRAIESVLAQQGAGVEIIIVDDGSTDNTAEAIRSLSDTSIRYISQTNQERGAARNAGITAARGKYVTFLDSDDVFLPGHLAGAQSFFQNNTDAGIYCASYAIRSTGNLRKIIHNYDINRELISGNPLSCNGVFLRKEIASEFSFSAQRELSGLEDWELWLRIACVHRFYAGKEITSEMRNHDGRSVLNVTPAQLEERFSLFNALVLANKNITSYYSGQINKLIASGETYIALHLALTKKHRGPAIRHLLKAIKTRPSVIFTRRFLAILKHLP